jgi:hypothetical protein
MDRVVQFLLNKVASVPTSLREDPGVDVAAAEVSVNLGALFLHHYFDGRAQTGSVSV